VGELGHLNLANKMNNLGIIIGLLLCLNSCGVNAPSTEKFYENTTRSGSIYSDECWRGVIEVTGDVTIYSGTLSIEAGTTLKFKADSDDQAGGSTTPITDPYYPHDPAVAHSQISSINLQGGNLYAVGASDNKITFTSTASSAEAGNWDCIQYNKTGSNLNLQNTIIEYGYYGIQINAAANDSNIVLKNNTIRRIVASGITCGINSGLQVALTISGNNISYCGHEGIATYQNKTLTIESNTFHDIWNYVDGPSGAGVVIENNNSTVRDNQFLRNCIGIIVTGESQPSISGNTFTDNGNNYNGYVP
jgi:parallel beta-helix repeat protein